MLKTEIKTKITVRIWPRVMSRVNERLRDMHIKRDSYLNSLLKDEIENLANEIEFTTPLSAKKRSKSD